MAVQAPCPPNPFRTRDGVFEDQSENNLRYYSNLVIQPPQIFKETVFGDPESNLTCNFSSSRKRNRDDTVLLTPLQQQILQQQLLSGSFSKTPMKTASAAISSGVDFSREEYRSVESAAASTSGRSASSPISQDLAACLHHQSIELEALIRLQNEKLRLGLEGERKRHFRSLISAIEHIIVKRLKEKETELDCVRRRNAELEEKVKQMIAENQIWCHVAKSNEAIVLNLRASLEQILLRNMGAAAEEGSGDSFDSVAVTADVAQSCCYQPVEEKTVTLQNVCKVCRERRVSVLLLPCRHLCLCKGCESSTGFCPICNSVKNASLQIFMS